MWKKKQKWRVFRKSFKKNNIQFTDLELLVLNEELKIFLINYLIKMNGLDIAVSKKSLSFQYRKNEYKEIIIHIC